MNRDEHEHNRAHVTFNFEVGENLSCHLGKLIELLQGKLSPEDNLLLKETLSDTASIARRLKILDAVYPTPNQGRPK